MLKFLLSCLCLCGLLSACAKPDHYQNQFVLDREQYDWTLDNYAIDLSGRWEAQLQEAMHHAHCSGSLEHYLLYSSDIIEAHHKVDLAQKQLTDECLALTLVFIRDVLSKRLQMHDSVAYSMNLAHNTNLTDRSMAYMIELAKSVPFIRSIDLRGNAQISQDAIYTTEFETNIKVVTK